MDSYQNKMDTYEETFETWNKVACLYQDKFMDLDIYNESYDFFCSLTRPSAKLLEMGCGPGNISKYLLTKRPDLNIFGIDIAPKMIELARQNNPGARFAIMDCRKMDEISQKYDGVISGFCLPYLSQNDVEKIFRDCSALLNGDGLLYTSFIARDPDRSGFQEGSSGGRTYFYFHSADEIKRQLHANGFRLTKTFEVEYHKTPSEEEIHTVIIAKKE